MIDGQVMEFLRTPAQQSLDRIGDPGQLTANDMEQHITGTLNQEIGYLCCPRLVPMLMRGLIQSSSTAAAVSGLLRPACKI